MQPARVLAVAAAAAASVSVAVAGPVRPQQYTFANRTVVQICSDTVVRVARVPVDGNFSAVDGRVSLIAQRDWEHVQVRV
jgi:hypothetical protein